MNSKAMILTAAGCLGAIVVLAQAPPAAAPQQGPGVQAPQDARYAEKAGAVAPEAAPMRLQARRRHRNTT